MQHRRLISFSILLAAGSPVEAQTGIRASVLTTSCSTLPVLSHPWLRYVQWRTRIWPQRFRP
jgi:hypothetical protein